MKCSQKHKLQKAMSGNGIVVGGSVPFYKKTSSVRLARGDRIGRERMSEILFVGTKWLSFRTVTFTTKLIQTKIWT